MRDIKFRAWDNHKKKMIATGYHVIGEVTMFGVIDQWVQEQRSDIPSLEYYNHIIEMQFTGLHDKHGNEIYEGDILKRSKELEPSFVAVIEFKNGMFGGTTKPYNNHFIGMPRLNKCDYDGGGYDEIIGNIYEHPSLLNQ